MAVDVCSSLEPLISPRISFSHDLNNQSSETTDITSIVVTTTATFDFCITPNLNLPPITSADELFLDGVLLPTQIKKPKSVVLENEVMDVHRKRLKELLSENDEKHEKSVSRSFWKFTRTTSLNSGNGAGPKRLLKSLSLKRLLHSNSNSNPTLNPRGSEDTVKVIKKSSSRKESSVSSSCFSSVHTNPSVSYTCLATTNNGSDSRRWSLPKKDSNGGIQINHVLNIPSTYNMNMFGYGSLFCKSKQKSKNK